MTLVFIHVPKTGGGTFNYILANQYKDKKFKISDLYPEQSIRYLFSIGDKINDFDCIYGHLTDQLVGQISTPRTLTFIRDPLKRFISEYNYIKRSPHNKNYERVKSLNIMDYTKLAQSKYGDNKITRYLSNNLRGPLTQIDFEKAESKLQSIDLILLTEYFDQSVLIASKMFNWKRPYYLRRNTNRGRIEPIDNNEIEKIETLHVYDRKLYNLSKERFTKLLEKYQLYLDDNLELFQRRNQRFNNTHGVVIKLWEKLLIKVENYKLYVPPWKKEPHY